MTSICFLDEEAEQRVLLIEYLNIFEQLLGLSIPLLVPFTDKGLECVDQTHKLREYFLEEREEHLEEGLNVDPALLHFGEHVVGLLNMLEPLVGVFYLVKIEFVQNASEIGFYRGG
jgi:hypothetical protein